MPTEIVLQKLIKRGSKRTKGEANPKGNKEQKQRYSCPTKGEEKQIGMIRMPGLRNGQILITSL